MALEFPDTDFTPTEIQSSTTVFDAGFFTIAVAASSVSAYTTYLGFSYDLPKLVSLVIAGIIGIGLLLINFRIKEYKVAGDSLTGALCALLFFFIISFISNTNAIYTYFLQNDIVGNTQEDAYRVFDSETGKLISSVRNHDKTRNAIALSNQLTIERKNLTKQITDPFNPGMGDKANVHLKNIEKLLGVSITRLAAPHTTAPLHDHEQYAMKLDELIHTQFQSKQADGNEIAKFLDRIDGMRDFYAEEINLQNYSSTTTDLMKRDLESLKVDAKNMLGINEPLLEINNRADEIGSFQYTWENFIDRIIPAAITLSILLSIVLDLLTPALSLLLYKKNLDY